MTLFDRCQDFLGQHATVQLILNDFLRIGSTIFILGFYILSFILVLFDKKASDSGSKLPAPLKDGEGEKDPSLEGAGLPVPFCGSKEESAADTSSFSSLRNSASSQVGTLFLFASVLAFPWLFNRGLHGILILAPLGVYMFLGRGVLAGRLGMRSPEFPGVRELLCLAAASLIVFGLTIFRWREVPPSMNGDVATICLSGLNMWKTRSHPFYINGSTLPALLDTLYGLFVLVSPDRILATRLHPLLCAVLCPIFMYRWMRLIGPKSLSWLTTGVFIIAPFFQYYSRVPMGTSLILMELIFLYGLTRCFVCCGFRGPLLGGIALGLSHWDYYGARVLVATASMAPLLALPYWRKLEKGWWWRLIALGAIALPFVLAFPIMTNYDGSRWTWYMSPAFFSIKNSDIARNPEMWMEKLKGHWQMWFDDRGNEARFMTVPGSSVLSFPLSGLGLVGMGFLILSFSSVIAPILMVLLFLGILCSLMSMGLPNGHRALMGCIPVVVCVGLGLQSLWCLGDWKSGRWLKGVRRTATFALLIWGSVASLWYFQVTMWKDERTVRAQEFDENTRPLRVLGRAATHDILLCSFPKDIDRFILDGKNYPVFDYGSWLPPNWAKKPLAVEATAHVQGLVALPKAVFERNQWEEFKDPAGGLAGWEYIAGSNKLGAAGVRKQWEETGKVSGTLMFPESGKADFTLSGYRIEVHSPVFPASSENSGSFRVLRGLNLISFKPLERDSPPPNNLSLIYQPVSGQTEEHLLSVADLYETPLHGWLRIIEEFAERSGGDATLQPNYSIVPEIYTHRTYEEPPLKAGHTRICRYRSVPHLPPGPHDFTIDLSDTREIKVLIGGHPIFPETKPERTYTFRLESDEINGQVFEIFKSEDKGPASISLEVRDPGSEKELPPYDWFTPASVVDTCPDQ
jgi:hypothetical protein